MAGRPATGVNRRGEAWLDRIQLSRPECLPEMFPAGVNEFGGVDDLVYLGLRAVAAYVVLLNDIVQGRALVHTVDDVPEYLLLPLGADVAAEE
jgi:hypothetical protein